MTESEAFINGWKAHENGVDIDDENSNPYHPESQEYSYDQWRSAWCDRFSCVKHGLELYLD